MLRLCVFIQSFVLSVATPREAFAARESSELRDSLSSGPCESEPVEQTLTDSRASPCCVFPCVRLKLLPGQAEHAYRSRMDAK